jgi:hypothetical protein
MSRRTDRRYQAQRDPGDQGCVEDGDEEDVGKLASQQRALLQARQYNALAWSGHDRAPSGHG